MRTFIQNKIHLHLSEFLRHCQRLVMGEPVVDLSNIQIDLLFGKILFSQGLGAYCFTRNRTMIGNLFEYVLKSLVKSKETTRMHSSRMRTARLLPVSPSMHCSGGDVPS